MKNWKSKLDTASRLEDIGNLPRKQRRFLAAITRKIVDSEVILKDPAIKDYEHE